MELIRTLREKFQTKKQEVIQRQAEDIITLSDFGSNFYIACQGTLLVSIQEDWNSKQIVEELSKIRQNYCNAKMKQQC